MLAILAIALVGWMLEKEMVTEKHFDYSKAPHAFGDVRLFVDPGREEAVLSCIKKFAENRKMATSIRVVDPKNGGWAADFWNEMLNVSGSNNPGKSTVTFAFYVDENVKEGSVLVNDIMSEFKAFVSKIPGVTVL